MAKTATGQTLRGTLTGVAMIDWSINVGNIMVLFGVFSTLILYAFRSGKFAEGIAMMKEDISEMKEVSKDIAKLLTAMAVQTNQMNSDRDRVNLLDKRVEDLRKGNGFIVPKADRPL